MAEKTYTLEDVLSAFKSARDEHDMRVDECDMCGTHVECWCGHTGDYEKHLEEEFTKRLTCAHENTTKKFGGFIICSECGVKVGEWR